MASDTQGKRKLVDIGSDSDNETESKYIYTYNIIDLNQ